MKPYTISKRVSVSPEVFVMGSPVLYNADSNEFTTNKTIGIILGNSVNYNLSRRFGLSFNYKLNLSTSPGILPLSFFLIGSRMNL